ncbi:MAG TPA: Hsp20/alpha crystallin family protein [Thermomicrobiaceae bacterium]|nr:Hsp20/alpha crystallin family protein [Thermomicrobiaceae bacterium]
MLERWDPRPQVERLLDQIDLAASEAMRRGRTFARAITFHPAIDLYETPEALVIKAAIPGATLEDLDITIAGKTLTLRGSCGYTLADEEAREATWHTAEIVSGEFTEILTLPEAVDPEQVQVTYGQGILTLTMAKTKETRAQRIPVRSAATEGS